MIRILQIGMSDNLGGIEMFIINCYRYIDRSQFQFDFINMYDNKLCFQDEIESLGGIVYKTHNEKKYPLRYKKELERILKNNNYDIVHIHKNSVAFDISLRIIKKCGINVRIIHSHNTNSSSSNFVIDLLHRIHKQKITKYCNHFFACSKEAGEWMYTKKILSSNNFLIVNNAIDLDKFKYDEKIRREKRKELTIKDDVLVIGHVGRFTQQKNHTFLIDVFKEIHKINEKTVLILVGQGPLMGKIKEKVCKLNLSNCVKFLGQRDDINELYQAFDIFLMPSLYEGLGIVLIEAQSANCYCFASTNVPRLCKITENIEFLSLNNSSKKWAEKIMLDVKKIKGIDLYNQIASSGFSIKHEVVKLQNKYFEYLYGGGNDVKKCSYSE